MLVTINDLSDPPRQVEIDLPFYRTIDTSNDRFEVNYFYKVEERDGKLWRLEICINGLTGINIQVVEDFSFEGATGDFITGQGSYSVIGAEEFGWALNRVRQTLERMEQ